MTTVSSVLVDILDDLTGKDFKRFKWFLTEGKLPDIESIKVCKLENASSEDTVNLMIEQYTQSAGDVAEKILRKMNQNHLADQLKKSLSEVQSQTVEVDGTAQAAGAPGAPRGTGVLQTIRASETSRVQAPVISGGQYNAPVNFTFQS